MISPEELIKTAPYPRLFCMVIFWSTMSIHLHSMRALLYGIPSLDRFLRIPHPVIAMFCKVIDCVFKNSRPHEEQFQGQMSSEELTPTMVMLTA